MIKTKKQPTTSNFKKNKKHAVTIVHYFWNVAKTEIGIDEKSNIFKN